MKLIDLLVQELPKRGGWPLGIEKIHQSAIDGEIYKREAGGEMTARKTLYLPIADNPYSEVTKHEYEAALAASKQNKWNGEGLPPVGCECEVISPGYKNKRFDRFIDQKVTVVAHDFIGPDPVAVFRMPVNGDEYEQDYHAMIAGCFRPIRTEAGRKREYAAKSMLEVIESQKHRYTENAYMLIYDAIAAGKLPGVKLGD